MAKKGKEWGKDETIIIFGAFVLAAGAFGFGYKFLDFAKALFSTDFVSFAVMPMFVYIIVTTGFFFLFLWSVLKGDLRNIEQPKYRMLELEEQYEMMEKFDEILSGNGSENDSKDDSEAWKNA
jgi:hypothetical protein